MKYDLDTLRGDVFGGLTSAVVGIPVALGFGIVSGLGPLAGMYGAIAVGFFAAVFGGTRSQISGPTGPMAVAMAVIVTSYADSLAEAFMIAIMAGLIQILLGAIRIGRYVAYTPYSVISGFMSGIGLIILILQSLPFLGASVAEGGPLAAIRAWPDAIGDLNIGAVIIAATTLVVGIAWPIRFRRFLPPTLVALAVGTIIGLFWAGEVPVIGEVPTGLPEFRVPIFSVDLVLGALQPAFTLAMLGSIDSLLTSLIADSMTRTRHKPNRELIGQGIGNVVAGFLGGLPGAGATMGTVVNLRAGGRTPVSGMIRSLVLLALVLGLGDLVEAIPHAVLAGILMKVGWDIIDWRFLTRIHHIQRDHLVVMVVTMGLTVFLDLVTAVIIGLLVAGMVAARQFERLELDSVISVPLLDQSFLDSHEGDEFSARVGLVAFRGSFTVASAGKMISVVSIDIRDHEVVILDFSDTTFVDDSAALVIEQLIDSAIAENTDCVVVGLSGAPASVIDALDALRRIPADRIVSGMEEGRRVAHRLLESR